MKNDVKTTRCLGDGIIPAELFGSSESPAELQFSMGKWPKSGTDVDVIEISRSDSRGTRLMLRRYPRMSRHPTELIYNDAVVAGVELSSISKRVTCPRPRFDGQEDSSSGDGGPSYIWGSIASRSVGAYFNYQAEVAVSADAYVCATAPGPTGPRTEIRRRGEAAPCATLRDLTRPFDDKTTFQISIPSADLVDVCLILCIVADVINEKCIFDQKAKQNALVSGICNACCNCVVS